jgi:hypothetical protein
MTTLMGRTFVDCLQLPHLLRDCLAAHHQNHLQPTQDVLLSNSTVLLSNSTAGCGWLQQAFDGLSDKKWACVTARQRATGLRMAGRDANEYMQRNRLRLGVQLYKHVGPHIICLPCSLVAPPVLQPEVVCSLDKLQACC